MTPPRTSGVTQSKSFTHTISDRRDSYLDTSTPPCCVGVVLVLGVGKHNHPAIVSQLLSNDKMDASLKNRDNDTVLR